MSLSKKIIGRFLLAVMVVLSVVAVGCQTRTDDVEVGTLQRVSQAPYVFEPHIAVDPTNPDHLAAIVISVTDFECARGCKWRLLLYISTDGGGTWTEQEPFGFARFSGDGVVGFGPDGTLYAVGLAGDRGKVAMARFDADGQTTPSSVDFISMSWGSDKPWLTIDPRSGALYVPYSGPIGSPPESEGVKLQRSTDGGETWSDGVEIERGVDVSAHMAGQEIPPFGVQVMLGNGENLAVAWVWSPGVDNWPVGVWVATSGDGGETFSESRQIAESWGFISTAFHSGTYYVFYRRGTEQDQELVVAISHDGGETRESSLVSGDVPLHFDLDKAPGVNVAPNGTLDVIFYAHGEGAPDCIDLAAFRKRREEAWIDACVYDVYYTFSKDGGQTFSPPLRLNEKPIVGARFVRTYGSSRPGVYIGMASTDKYAYPIWIDTQGEEGTQAYTVQIKR